MTGHPAAVEVVDLVKRFPVRGGWRGFFRQQGEKVALDRVSLTIEHGEVFGLLGPNGTGKTTLIKILSTLVLPNAGTAWVSGFDVVEHGQEVRRRIGVIYGDERTFFWRLSVLENLRFYAALYRIPQKRAEARIAELLDFVGLARDASLQMHHFSTGMKQRAAIARGLLNDPEVLFMDEPTRGLDPLAAQELRQFVRQRVATGQRTVLLATNVMTEVEELCHRVAFLNHGQVQMIGPIDELRRLLQMEEVHVLVVSKTDPAQFERLRRLPGLRSLEVTAQSAGTYRLVAVTQRGAALAPAIIREIVQHGGEVWASVPQELSLDTMFALAVNGAMPSVRPAAADRPLQGSVPRR